MIVDMICKLLGIELMIRKKSDSLINPQNRNIETKNIEQSFKIIVLSLEFFVFITVNIVLMV